MLKKLTRGRVGRHSSPAAPRLLTRKFPTAAHLRVRPPSRACVSTMRPARRRSRLLVGASDDGRIRGYARKRGLSFEPARQEHSTQQLTSQRLGSSSQDRPAASLSDQTNSWAVLLRTVQPLRFQTIDHADQAPRPSSKLPRSGSPCCTVVAPWTGSGRSSNLAAKVCGSPLSERWCRTIPISPSCSGHSRW